MFKCETFKSVISGFLYIPPFCPVLGQDGWFQGPGAGSRVNEASAMDTGAGRLDPSDVLLLYCRQCLNVQLLVYLFALTRI